MICPLSVRSRPLTRLTKVVLPAPLEPISARTSPSMTVKSTLFTAMLSPKALVSAWVVSRAMSALRLHLCDDLLDRAHDAGWQHEDEHEQDHSEQQLPVGGESDRVGLQEVERNGAHDRSDESAEAAQHGHEDDLAGESPDQDVRACQSIERRP